MFLLLIQAVIPLCHGVDVGSAMELIKSCDDTAIVTENEQGIIHIRYVFY